MNKRLTLKILASTALITVASNLIAQNHTIGTRSLGLGGTGVATANDYNAVFLNPAALTHFKKVQTQSDARILEYSGFGFGFDFGGGYSMEGQLEEYVDELADLTDKLDTIDSSNLTSSNIIDLIDAVSLLDLVNQPGNAFLFDGNSGFATRVKGMGIGVRTHLEAYGHIQEVDYVNVGLDFSDSQDLIGELIDLSGTSFTAAESDPITEFDIAYDPQKFPTLNEEQFNQILTAVNEGLLGDVVLTEAEVEVGLRQLDVEIANAIEQGAIEQDQLQNAIDGVVPFIENLPETDAATNGSTDSNRSSIAMRGFGHVEVPFSFSKNLSENFSIGTNVKFMHGRVYGVSISVFDDDADEVVNRVRDNYNESSAFGLDIGAMYRTKHLNLGAFGRNLNAPKFDGLTYTSRVSNDQITIGSVTLDPQLTLGAAWIPNKKIIVEANIDALKTDAFNGQRTNQYSKVGVQWQAFNFLVLRGGYYTNIAENKNGDVFSAGIGLRISRALIELAGSSSLDTTTIDGEDVPLESRLSASFSLRY